MKMNVENTLSCLLAAVGNNSETVLKVEVFGKLCDNFIDMCDKGLSRQALKYAA
jgi:hypothetical protein